MGEAGDDLYDDIFDNAKETISSNSVDLDDLYGDIYNPEVAESALSKVKLLSSENEKFKGQNTQLKEQISILTRINHDLKSKNQNLEKNIKNLIETARVEINRKNDQLKNLRAELDNVLFKRAARNINKKELETIMAKHRPKEDPYKLPTKPKVLKTVVESVSLVSPDLNVGNRQFVKKRKRESSPSKVVPKKIKIDDNNKENSDSVNNDANPKLCSVKSSSDTSNMEVIPLGPASNSILSSPQNIRRDPKNDVSVISKYVKDRNQKRKSKYQHQSLTSDVKDNTVKNDKEPDKEINEKANSGENEKFKPKLFCKAVVSEVPSVDSLKKPHRVYVSFDDPEAVLKRPAVIEDLVPSNIDIDSKLLEPIVIVKEEVVEEGKGTKSDAPKSVTSGSSSMFNVQPIGSKESIASEAHDSENNCTTIPQSDHEASTSSQLKSPITKVSSLNVNGKNKSDPATSSLIHELCETKTVSNDCNQQETDKIDYEGQVKYESTRWNCSVHLVGFRTRGELRIHRNKNQCMKLKDPADESNKVEADINSSKTDAIVSLKNDDKASNSANDGKADDVEENKEFELELQPLETFEDELDFEPSEPEVTEKNISFKSLNTNFSIPKKDKTLSNNQKETIKSTPAKAKAQERAASSKKGNESKSRARSRSPKRVARDQKESRNRSKSCRRKSRSRSRRRRSKSNEKRKASRRRTPSNDRERRRRKSSRFSKRSRSRGRNDGPRSLSKDRLANRKHLPTSKLEQMSRKSQSLSPERLKESKSVSKSVKMEDNLSLASLEAMKQKLLGKISSQNSGDIEEGEISDSNDEEVQAIINSKDVELRSKSRSGGSPMKRNVLKDEDKKDSRAQRNKSTDNRIKSSIGMKACLKEYTEDDIENKLIPFKKRQFHELQFEELKIKKQIERARSKSNTPVRSVSESSACDFPLSSIAKCADDDLLTDLKLSPVVDMRVKKSIDCDNFGSVTSPNDFEKSLGNLSKSVTELSKVKNATPSKSKIDKQKVSPIKLSLRGVVIQSPSSNSSDAVAENVEVILEQVENNKDDNSIQDNDNAIFSSISPKSPLKNVKSKDIGMVSKDLFLTDDSDLEEDISNNSTTSKVSLKGATDQSSPEGINNILKSTYHGRKISTPVVSKGISNHDSNQIVTSTPCSSSTNTVSYKRSNVVNLKKVKQLNSTSVPTAKKKPQRKRITLGRSITTDS